MMELPDILVVLSPLTYREGRPAAHESSVGEIIGCLLTPSCDLEAGVGCAHQILSILLICYQHSEQLGLNSYSLCYLG